MPLHKISIKTTSTPSIIKFTSDQLLVKGKSYQYNNIDEAKESPLSLQLFQLPFVSKVFISANFVAIEKFESVEWETIQEDIRELIEIYLNNGDKAVIETKTSEKINVEIYAEETPNPSVMKFCTNKSLSKKDFEYKNKESATNSPLATKLFKYPYIKEIYIAENYISITKKETAEWSFDIVNELREFIKTYIEEDKLIIDKTIPFSETKNSGTNFKELKGTSLDIAKILDEYVKPAVAADGGNIIFESYDKETQIVNVILQGACSGCPSSTITLKNGIETMLKEMLPDRISSVIATNG